MSEIVNGKKVFSLLEVTKGIQKTLTERFTSAFWIKAEMNKLNHYPHSGHCYPELLEKKDGIIVAEMKATLWKNDFQKINANFLRVLKEPLKNGINILFFAKITFTPTHGLGLSILDIDPIHTLGDLAREKQETIDRLKAEKIFSNNKSLKIATLPKRIAIISVETSKGYSDFLSVINGNSWGYKFFLMLFPALLQGEKAVESILKQLTQIKRVWHHFDAVVIIRGGGGDVGLTCYNNYALSREIATYPLPILTGIGHSTNETVAEMIAFKNAITPTELADYLMQKFHNFSVPVQKAQERLVEQSRRQLKDEKLKLLNTVKYFRSVTGTMLLQSRNDIQSNFKAILSQSSLFIKKSWEDHQFLEQRLNEGLKLSFLNENQKIAQLGYAFRKDVIAYLNQSKLILSQCRVQIEKGSRQVLLTNRQSLEGRTVDLRGKSMTFLKEGKLVLVNLERVVDLMNPINVLKRGYSITLKNGRAVRSIEGVVSGDSLTSILSDGELSSTVKNIKKSDSA